MASDVMRARGRWVVLASGLAVLLLSALLWWLGQGVLRGEGEARAGAPDAAVALTSFSGEGTVELSLAWPDADSARSQQVEVQIEASGELVLSDSLTFAPGDLDAVAHALTFTLGRGLHHWTVTGPGLTPLEGTYDPSSDPRATGASKDGDVRSGADASEGTGGKGKRGTKKKAGQEGAGGSGGAEPSTSGAGGTDSSTTSPSTAAPGGGSTGSTSSGDRSPSSPPTRTRTPAPTQATRTPKPPTQTTPTSPSTSTPRPDGSGMPVDPENPSVPFQG